MPTFFHTSNLVKSHVRSGSAPVPCDYLIEKFLVSSSFRFMQPTTQQGCGIIHASCTLQHYFIFALFKGILPKLLRFLKQVFLSTDMHCTKSPTWSNFKHGKLVFTGNDYYPASCPFLLLWKFSFLPLLIDIYSNIYIIYSWSLYLLCKSQNLC